jgi:hypothetical protein
MSQRPEETAELKRLMEALPDAIKRARKILQQSGPSTRLEAADAEVSRLIARIDQILNHNHDHALVPEGSKT